MLCIFERKRKENINVIHFLNKYVIRLVNIVYLLKNNIKFFFYYFTINNSIKNINLFKLNNNNNTTEVKKN